MSQSTRQTDITGGPPVVAETNNRIAARVKAWLARVKGLPLKWVWAMGALAIVAVGAGIVAVVVQREAPRVVAVDFGGPLVYHDFPDVIADLRSEGRMPRYVKLGIVVELPEDLRPRLEASQTEVIDALHGYLRDQTRGDLIGEAGASRVRAELTTLIDARIAPGHVKSVLFRQFILN